MQRKLTQSPNLFSQERRNIEGDIQWLNATAAGTRNLPPPDPKQPQRWLLELTGQEQMEINGANNQFANEIHQQCEDKYGGMAQFAGNGGHGAQRYVVNAPAAPPRHPPGRRRWSNTTPAQHRGWGCGGS